MDLSHEDRLVQLAQLRHAQNLLRQREPELFTVILNVLTNADVIGIIDEDDPRSGERYAPIVGTILPRLSRGMPCLTIQTIIFEEMTAWFNTPPGGSIVGTPERYAEVAEHIWQVWNEHLPDG
jgi:hypothetical protein